MNNPNAETVVTPLALALNLTPLHLKLLPWILSAPWILASLRRTVKQDARSILTLTVISFVCPVAAEVFGQNVGFFGVKYTYQLESHFGLFDPLSALTGLPLVLGLTWFSILEHCQYAIRKLSTSRSLHKVHLSALAATAMVFLDLMIDPVAVALGYWVWQPGLLSFLGVPIENFAAWWTGGFLAHWLLLTLNPKKKAVEPKMGLASDLIRSD